MHAIAIVGLDCLVPGAADAEAWIERSRRGEPALGPAPEGRWPVSPDDALADEPYAPDRVTSTVGGFVLDPDVPLPDLDLDVPIDAMDPLFRWTLRVCSRAVEQAKIEPRRTALLLGNLSLPSTGAIRASARVLGDMLGHPKFLANDCPTDRWHSGLPAQLAARALGLGLGGSSLDAACASGLYAVRLGCRMLASGRADAVVAAGVQRADSSFLFYGFSQLRALSPTGLCRPMDQRGDGLVIGEGAAAVVLKRLEDARADGDTIHAVIRGGGLGNDGRSGNMLAPQRDGQLRALRAAYDDSAVDPADVGYFECHATGTPVGDRTEVEALCALLADSDPTGEPPVVASAKQLVGHCITAAGLIGLIRAVAAVRDGVRFGSPGNTQPVTGIGPDGPLRVLEHAEPWTEPRRLAGVSAFGFGGTNAHLIVENWRADSTSDTAAAPDAPRAPLALVGLAARIGRAEGLHEVASAARSAESLLGPAPVAVTRGVHDPGEGAWIDAVRIDPARFRIPPVELAVMLPQQALMLDVASDALRGVPYGPQQTACIVGMGLDHHIGDYVVRQAAPAALADRVAPSLDASRVQGLLPNFLANRLASQLDLQGPSYVVSSEELSGLSALDQAWDLLDANHAPTVIVGAVDLPGHCGAAFVEREDGPLGEGAVTLVLTRLDHAEEEGLPVLAVFEALDTELADGGDAVPTPWRALFGRVGAADAMCGLLHGIVTGRERLTFQARGHHATLRMRQASDGGAALEAALARPTPRPANALYIPHSGPPLATPSSAGYRGRWDASSRVPVPTPRRPGERGASWVSAPSAPPETPGPLPWSSWYGHRDVPRVEEPAAPAPVPATAMPRVAVTANRIPDLSGIASMAAQLERSSVAMAQAHAVYLAAAQQAQGIAQAAAATAHGVGTTPAQAPFIAPPTPISDTRSSRPRPATPARPPRPIPPRPTVAVDDEPPRAMDLAALQRFAGGSISSALGSRYADLDAYEPRVRLPTDPLLLVSRVVSIEGTPRQLGPARIITEYDIPADAWWSHDGAAPPCVTVESGQADLLLASWLGADEHCRGERVYRLLDCDLTFHGDRPRLGETLRHDIRIHRFARLGETLLFYFEYDCTSKTDGRDVLTMRNGVAGFFTPDELSSPKGLVLPDDVRLGNGVTPVIPGSPTALDATATTALEEGRIADALGPVFAPCDASGLSIAKAPWRVVHRVTDICFVGGTYGLGGLIAEQDLRDDDWFNPCHFLGDPCMPGTLMFDGCTQAVATWLIASGAPSLVDGPARFEPIAGLAARLRCRAQVVPGHRLLTYEVRIREANLTDPEMGPHAIADVVLYVDGRAAVIAHDVGVRIEGQRRTPAKTEHDHPKLMEFSVGSPARAFGPALEKYDHKRTARMPGPPILQMTEVVDLHGTPGVVARDAQVSVAYDVPTEAWFTRAIGRGPQPLPLAVVLEVALQPCGWITAWQQAAEPDEGNVFFRNLGGDLTLFRQPTSADQRIVTTARVTSVSRSAGMTLYAFAIDMTVDGQPLAKGNSQFGYFTAQSLSDQKGLPLTSDDVSRREQERAKEVRIELADHPVLPRSDARMIDRVRVANPRGGKAGLGFYTADKDVDAAEWFFTAHFHQDPVMPGSLGLGALGQLATWVLHERAGAHGPFVPMEVEAPIRWKYRGQVPPRTRRLTMEIDVTAIDDGPEPSLVFDGLVVADGLAIYELFGLKVRPARPPTTTQVTPPPFSGPAALLDAFDASSGEGHLLLDPERQPWLDHHRPDLVTPAVPMAFAAEIAAEAASLLRPGRTVVGIPTLTASRWIHTGEGPQTLYVTARDTGDDRVEVELSMHHANLRYPSLSGRKAHMAATVVLGHAYPEASSPPPLADAVEVPRTTGDYYDSGHTFHGPVLANMTSLGRRSGGGASATIAVVADGVATGHGVDFVVDPVLLDHATHPMISGRPEVWNDAIPPGQLAYPVSCDNLRFHTARPPAGAEVQCELRVVHADPARLAFDVWMMHEGQVWCSFRWTEALVPGGPVLGAPEPVRKPFGRDRIPVPEIRVGRSDGDRWVVAREDLVEPIPGSLAKMYCSPAELAALERAPDPVRWICERIAVKEAARSAVVAHRGSDVHPAEMTFLAMRDDLYVTDVAPGLTAQEHIDVLGPTRVDIRVDWHDDTASARIVPKA